MLADSDSHETAIIPTPRATIEKQGTVSEEKEAKTPTQESPAHSPPPKEKLEKAKKGGRPPHPRKGKAGKNQYTANRDNDCSPHRSISRDVTSRDETETNGRTTHSRLAKNAHDDSAKEGPGRGRPGTGHGAKKEHRVSMLDMRRRVAGMLEFISRTQLEMAELGEMSTPDVPTPKDTGRDEAMKGVLATMNSMLQDANAASNADQSTPKDTNGDGKDKLAVDRSANFIELSLLEMMDVLTGELVKWQKAYT